MAGPAPNSSVAAQSPALLIVGSCAVRIWGLSAAQRHQRAFHRAGVREVYTDAGALPADRSVVMVRADYLLAEDLASALVSNCGAVLTLARGGSKDRIVVAAHAEAEDRPAALALLREGVWHGDRHPHDRLRALTPEQLGSAYNHALRKREAPLVLSLVDTPRRELERATFGSAYKGATDFVTKWCWPLPARWVTRWAAERGISPNQVTTASLVLVIVAAALFAQGWFLAAIPFAWAMTFLDTVDGKLARVTLSSSRWGNVYDHGIDLLHPPIWWWAWYMGLRATTGGIHGAALDAALWIVIGGYVLGRFLEGAFLYGFKIESHVWRPIDSLFRTITARRNPNLAILTVATLLGRPAAGFYAVAVWTVCSLIFHVVRLVQAVQAHRQGLEIRSWLSETT